jgi:4-hydroxybenzoate polyprenyltransferase
MQAYAQLVRLPNLPSAMSNICLGALASGALPGHWLPFLLLLLASACLYCGGMVWNDYFDREEDRQERRDRPIPAGRISPRDAARLGTILLAAGVGLAILAGWSLALLDPKNSFSTPIVLALLLVGSILLYDGPFKHNPIAPALMGLCRFLNVLLGVSVSGSLVWPKGVYPALVVGLYVVGLTWFSRTEARVSNQSVLRGAALIMLMALVLALFLPAQEPRASSPLFVYLLVGFGFFIGLPITHAIANPSSGPVQKAVTRALMGLILLDAILACGTVGTLGLLLLVLLVPSVLLNRQRWLYAT